MDDVLRVQKVDRAGDLPKPRLGVDLAVRAKLADAVEELAAAEKLHADVDRRPRLVDAKHLANVRVVSDLEQDIDLAVEVLWVGLFLCDRLDCDLGAGVGPVAADCSEAVEWEWW